MGDDEISRRDWLKAAAVFGGAAAVGSLLSEDSGRDVMVGGGGGGGGGAPPTDNPLYIRSSEVVTAESLGWYDSILWDVGGALVLEDGDSLGVVNGNE